MARQQTISPILYGGLAVLLLLLNLLCAEIASAAIHYLSGSSPFPNIKIVGKDYVLNTLPTERHQWRVFQGQATALSGNGRRAIWGGVSDSNKMGAAWVYGKGAAGNWTFEGKLVGPADFSGNASSQGYSVTLDHEGNTAVFGGIRDGNLVGALFIFVRQQNGKWKFLQKLVGKPAPEKGYQGWACTLQGSTLVASATSPDTDAKGRVWTYEKKPNGTFVQIGDPLAPVGLEPDDWFGSGLALSADEKTLVIGAAQRFKEPEPQIGGVYVFVRTKRGAPWAPQGEKLVGSRAIIVSNGHSEMGWNVALSRDGNTLVTGGPWDGDFNGTAWIFERIDGVWNETAHLAVHDSVGVPSFGASVSISGDGNLVAVGGDLDNNTVNLGATWLFGRNPHTRKWGQLVKLVGDGSIWDSEAQNTDENSVATVSQGHSVALDDNGKTLIVGGYGDGGNVGAVWLFDLTKLKLA